MSSTNDSYRICKGLSQSIRNRKPILKKTKDLSKNVTKEDFKWPVNTWKAVHILHLRSHPNFLRCHIDICPLGMTEVKKAEKESVGKDVKQLGLSFTASGSMGWIAALGIHWVTQTKHMPPSAATVPYQGLYAEKAYLNALTCT